MKVTRKGYSLLLLRLLIATQIVLLPSVDRVWADVRYAKESAVSSSEFELASAPAPMRVASDGSHDARFIAVPLKEFTVTATGTYRFSASTVIQDGMTVPAHEADAECSIDRADLVTGARWLPKRTYINEFPDVDWRDLKVSNSAGKFEIPWIPVTPTVNPESGSPGSCADPDADPNHTYVATIALPYSEEKFIIEDSPKSDNSGDIHVTLSPIPRAIYAGTNSPLPYECNKQVRTLESSDQEETTVADLKYIERAKIVLDARDDKLDLRSTTGYFEDTGHWGAVTCNHVDPNATYTVRVEGKFKFDALAPLGFAEADGECATGYPKGPSSQKDRYIPYHSNSKDQPNFLGFESTSTSTAQYQPYGRDWLPKRFYADPHPDNGSTADKSDEDPDDLKDYADVFIAGKTVNWNPKNSSGECDPNHEYEAIFAPGTLSWGSPLYFQILDVAPYYEFKSCGFLTLELIKEGTTTSSADIPDMALPSTSDCYSDSQGTFYGNSVVRWDLSRDTRYSYRRITLLDKEENGTQLGYYRPDRGVSRGFSQINSTLTSGQRKVRIFNEGKGPHTFTIHAITATMIDGGSLVDVSIPLGQITEVTTEVLVNGVPTTTTTAFDGSTTTAAAWGWDSSPECDQDNLDHDDCIKSGQERYWESPGLNSNTTRSVTVAFYCKTNNADSSGSGATSLGMRGRFTLVSWDEGSILSMWE